MKESLFLPYTIIYIKSFGFGKDCFVIDFVRVEYFQVGFWHTAIIASGYHLKIKMMKSKKT